MGLVQAKLVCAVVPAALQKYTMGLSFPAQTGLRSRSSQALGKQEQHHLCPTSFGKENLKKKILNASHLLISHPNSIPVSGGRGGRWFLRGEAPFRVEELPAPRGAAGSRNHQKSMCRMAWHLCPAPFCSTKTVLPREGESESHPADRVCDAWFMGH